MGRPSHLQDYIVLQVAGSHWSDMQELQEVVWHATAYMKTYRVSNGRPFYLDDLQPAHAAWAFSRPTHAGAAQCVT